LPSGFVTPRHSPYVRKRPSMAGLAVYHIPVCPFCQRLEILLSLKMEAEFCTQGYTYLMNQRLERRALFREGMLGQFTRLNDFLVEHSTSDSFLYDEFGWAETVFAPLFMRFWFLEYCKDFELPQDNRYARVRQWRDACTSHPAAQQVSKEQIVKLYYDYAKGAGNGALLPNRNSSSFALEPDWRTRPWPPRNKYEHSATDEGLGL
jgi:glutathione S-transferase